MSAFDQFWNFKLLLKERSMEADSRSPLEDTSVQQSGSVPFVNTTGLGAQISSVRQAESRYLQEAFPREVVTSTVEADAREAPGGKEDGKPIDLPKPADLDQMGVEELRRLRRRLALKLHPDRAGVCLDGRADDIMGQWNRLIDEAINRKKLRLHSD